MAKGKKISVMRDLLGGEVLRSRVVLKQIPLLLLILVFALFLVANRYRVESLTKEKLKLEERIDFLREQRVQMQRQYQESIRISRIDMVLDTCGVGIVAGPPYELRIDNKEKRQ